MNALTKNEEEYLQGARNAAAGGGDPYGLAPLVACIDRLAVRIEGHLRNGLLLSQTDCRIQDAGVTFISGRYCGEVLCARCAADRRIEKLEKVREALEAVVNERLSDHHRCPITTTEIRAALKECAS